MRKVIFVLLSLMAAPTAAQTDPDAYCRIQASNETFSQFLLTEQEQAQAYAKAYADCKARDRQNRIDADRQNRIDASEKKAVERFERIEHEHGTGAPDAETMSKEAKRQ